MYFAGEAQDDPDERVGALRRPAAHVLPVPPQALIEELPQHVHL